MRIDFAPLFSSLIIALCILWFLSPAIGWAGGGASFGSNHETMLMFVGEPLKVLTIASRREEAAWRAPAIAEVITRKSFLETGDDTLSEVLEKVPGFYIAQKEWGDQPYLRGIPDSFLLLYDTVPLGSNVTKSLKPIGPSLSLAPVKRIEIVRGPGSVLWGPDAFAGIVNVVPMTGQDLNGIETGLVSGEPNEDVGVYLNAGHDQGNWDAFLSLSGRFRQEDDRTYNVIRFWGEEDGIPVQPQLRFGKETVGKAHYIEATGHFSYSDWLSVTGRISENRRPYIMHSDQEDISWAENRRMPNGFIKIEANKDIDSKSLVRTTLSFSGIQSDRDIIDLNVIQSEKSAYGELIYDRTLFTGSGLFTGGLSFREKIIKNAPVWDGYLPEFLDAENELLLPILTLKDYNTRLGSVFGQYRHRFGEVDMWTGLRYDMHDDYQDHLSYNLGVAWSPHSHWMIKGLFGTAYRTPFARQLLENEAPDLEKIKSMNLMVAWDPSPIWGLTGGAFMSRIENHILEDTYAGLSEPNHQDLSGLELEGHLFLLSNLKLSGNITKIDNAGPQETYKYNDFTFIRPDGTVEQHFIDLRYPYDLGANTILNLFAEWRPHKNFKFFLHGAYFSSRRLGYLNNDSYVSETVSGEWLLDATLSWTDILSTGADLFLSLENLTDVRYETPGSYGFIEGQPATATVFLRKYW